MSDKNNKKTMMLIATAIGAIMGIYVKAINEIRKDLIQEKKNEALDNRVGFHDTKNESQNESQNEGRQ